MCSLPCRQPIISSSYHPQTAWKVTTSKPGRRLAHPNSRQDLGSKCVVLPSKITLTWPLKNCLRYSYSAGLCAAGSVGLMIFYSCCCYVSFPSHFLFHACLLLLPILNNWILKLCSYVNTLAGPLMVKSYHKKLSNSIRNSRVFRKKKPSSC